MKILFLARSLNCGGAERQLVLLARGLHQRGHEVAVALFYSGGPLEQDLKTASVRILPLYKRGRWDMLGFLTRLIRTVLKERPDVLHSYICNLFTVIVQPLLPSLKVVWGVRSSYVDFSRYDWLFRASYMLACRFSRSADLIIANSQAGRQGHIDDGYPKEKTVVIPNGIDTARFFPNPEARERMRTQWGIKKEETLIGLVGRLDPMKDHESFLSAAALLLRERPQMRFVCVGGAEGAYRTTLKARAGALGLADYVLWVDSQSNVADVYNALDLLVNSSSYGEGFANVLGEAMACGVPCVATDIGDSRLIVGTLGEVVPPKNTSALKAGMQRVLDRELSATEIRQRIVDRFSLEHLILTTERTLLALCHQAGTKVIEKKGNTSTC